MNMKAGYAALLSLLLAACQSTSLENLPTGATTACPPAWPGAWIGLDDDTGAPVDVGFLVARDCTTTLVETHEGKPRETAFSPRFAGGSGTFLVFVRSEDAAHLFEGRAPQHSGWYPFEWDFAEGGDEGDVLSLRAPDHRRIATLIVNGALDGMTTWNRNECANFVYGDEAQIATALHRAVSFMPRPDMRLRRVGQTRRDLDRAIARATRAEARAADRSRRERERP
jgi:hypothetical protein